MYKAFQQVEEADLVIFFYNWEEWKIEKPYDNKIEGIRQLNRNILKESILKMAIKRDLVVVILDKRESDIKMDEISKFLKTFGFKRIIFQAGVSNMHPDGRPILKEEYL